MAGQIVRVWRGYRTEAGVDRYCRDHAAGDGYEDAVVEPVVREPLNRFDDRVTHVTVAFAAQ